MISIIIPTITGREESLERTVSAYEKRTWVEREIIVIRDAPTWPKGCNLGAQEANGDILHFSADDLEPVTGWHTDVARLLAADELPAPRVHDYEPDGLFMNQSDGADGDLTLFTRIPIMSRSQYERIGPWPEIIYYADIWLSEKARTVGIQTRMLYSYAFVHHWCQIGRVDTPENLHQSGKQLARLKEAM